MVNPSRPGVYELRYLTDGRRAFYTIGWTGLRSPLRYLGAAEGETDLIADMAEALADEYCRPQLELISPHASPAA